MDLLFPVFGLQRTGQKWKLEVRREEGRKRGRRGWEVRREGKGRLGWEGVGG